MVKVVTEELDENGEVVNKPQKKVVKSKGLSIQSSAGGGIDYY